MLGWLIIVVHLIILHANDSITYIVAHNIWCDFISSTTFERERRQLKCILSTVYFYVAKVSASKVIQAKN